MNHQIDRRALIDKPIILGTDGHPGLFNVGNTTFYELIRTGRFPKPVKLGRKSLWRAADVYAALEKLTAEG
jgi:hypothetical protein